ncbi:MAG: FAD-binding protein [Candidatus Poribacteria bacterium]|nr:FAD-binding protein [Candidatus Poribacteria bacterium]
MIDNNLYQLHKELRSLLGTRFITDRTVRETHATDASYHKGSIPDAVVFPKSNAEVSKIVKCCDKYKIPIIPYGTGTGVEGAVVCIEDALCVSLNEMNEIISVSTEDRYATVQSGVTRNQLNAHLTEIGTRLHFPVDPGADASLGGMAATRASGTCAVLYGTMLDNVLGLTVITTDGTEIQTGGKAIKSAAGYDLTRLFIGSEGTLGIITEITLKLARLPETISAAICSFHTVNDAINTVINFMNAGIEIARIELLDEIQMDAVNNYSNLDYEVAPTLFLEFHGSTNTVTEYSEDADRIASENGSVDFRWTTDENERKRLWQARYDSYFAALNLRPGSVGYVTDVCVPISQLAMCITETKSILVKSNLLATMLGHVGDGNFHVVFPLEPGNSDELDEAQQISNQIVDIALEMGGTCTGEHGIGLGKRAALQKEHGNAVDIMRTIKLALDPKNIMNPGKIFI